MRPAPHVEVDVAATHMNGKGAGGTARCGRVAILHQGFVPSYRKSFFEQLSKAGPIEYIVFYGDPPVGSGLKGERGPFDFPSVHVKNFVLPFMGRSLVWQPVLRDVFGGDFDGVVIGHEARFLANNLILLGFKALRRPVLYWGHGVERARDVSGLGRLPRAAAVAAKRLMARRADGFLVYTEGGRQRLIDDGVQMDRITVVRNTLDVSEERLLALRCLKTPMHAVRQELGFLPDSIILVFVGRIYSEKRLDDLPEAILTALDQQWIRRPVEVAIIGDGPDAQSLQRRWRGSPWMHFPGALFGYDAARYFRVAAGVVIPGAVGLAVNHAFAHGVPVITRESDLHGPEIEYLEDGANGLIVHGNRLAFAQALAQFVHDDALQARLAAGAGRTSETLHLRHMVTAFDDAVRCCLGRVRATVGREPPD